MRSKSIGAIKLQLVVALLDFFSVAALNSHLLPCDIGAALYCGPVDNAGHGDPNYLFLAGTIANGFRDPGKYPPTQLNIGECQHTGCGTLDGYVCYSWRATNAGHSPKLTGFIKDGANPNYRVCAADLDLEHERYSCVCPKSDSVTGLSS